MNHDTLIGSAETGQSSILNAGGRTGKQVRSIRQEPLHQAALPGLLQGIQGPKEMSVKMHTVALIRASHPCPPGPLVNVRRAHNSLVSGFTPVSSWAVRTNVRTHTAEVQATARA